MCRQHFHSACSIDGKLLRHADAQVSHTFAFRDGRYVDDAVAASITVEKQDQIAVACRIAKKWGQEVSINQTKSLAIEVEPHVVPQFQKL